MKQLIAFRFHNTKNKMACLWDDFYVEEDFENLDFNDDEPLPVPPHIQEDDLTDDEIHALRLDENEIQDDKEDDEEGIPIPAEEEIPAPPKKKTRTRKVIPKRTTRFTRENATIKATEYVTAAMTGITTDPLFAKPFQRAILSIALVAMLYTFVNDIKFHEFSADLISNMWRVITAGDNKPLCYAQTLVTHFHTFCTDDEFLDKWDALLNYFQIERGQIESDCVIQHILDKVLEAIITDRNAADLPHLQDTITASKLTHAEEQILNYVSGYIPHALLKHYKKMKTNVTATKYVDIMKRWSTDELYGNGYCFLQYTQGWINAQNRGGLFKPNAELYLFFRALENETRNHLHTSLLGTYRDVNLRTLLLKKLSSKHLIQHYWAKLVGSESLSTVESKHLFYVTVDYFVNIRIKAFVRVYNDLKQLTDKTLSRKGSKSLRKELDDKY